MKNLKKGCMLFLAFILFQNSLFAEEAPSAADLDLKRKQAISEYLSNLAHKDVQKIEAQFVPEGTITSPQGSKLVSGFFSSFYPAPEWDLKWITTELRQIFTSSTDNNHYLVKYVFKSMQSFDNIREAEYLNEFVFMDGSELLQGITMYGVPQFSQ